MQKAGIDISTIHQVTVGGTSARVTAILIVGGLLEPSGGRRRTG